MSRIFLSHSSANNAEAIAVRDWLAQQGWDDVFLDLDPERGLVAGDSWQAALKAAVDRCELVIFIVSPDWAASTWCKAEFLLTKHGSNPKAILPVIVVPTPFSALPGEMTAEYQSVDLTAGARSVAFTVTLPPGDKTATVAFSEEGLQRLKIGVERSGVDAKHFAWPPASDPERPPYLGLRPLEAEDAGIFFGRDAPVIEALDRLRGLREGAPPRLLVILGASGSGKSSFMRAGLLPRLARDDRQFLPLPIVRPERAAISGESGLLSALVGAYGKAKLAVSRADLRTAIDGGAATLRPLLHALAAKATPAASDGAAKLKPPTLILPIDQGEELFLAEGADEAAAFLTILSELLKEDTPALIALFTIRSDNYERLQMAKPLEGLRQQTSSLPPMPKGAYAEVIKGPARRLEGTRRALKVEEGLVQGLLADIEAGGAKDALPLLAFTLERLYREHGGDGNLSFADYQQLGGIEGSIEAAVEGAFKAADKDPAIPRDRQARLALLRRGLIPWLAGIDPDTGAPRRRVARLSEIPEEARPLAQHLVEQRLLSTDVAKDTGERTIEPAHEALLRQWGLLQGWLTEDSGLLSTMDAVKRGSRDWMANGKGAAWLTHATERLKAAEGLLERPDLAANLEPTDHGYLAACRKAEQAALKKERAGARNRKLMLAVVGVLMAGMIAGLIAWINQTHLNRVRGENLNQLASKSTNEALTSDDALGTIKVQSPQIGDPNAKFWRGLMSSQQFAMYLEYKNGRVIAVAHDAALNPKEQSDLEFFGVALDWLSDGNKRKTVLVSSGHCEVVGYEPDAYTPGLAPKIKELGYANSESIADLTKINQRTDVAILIVGNMWGENLSEDEIRAVEAFVTNGGGLLVAGLGWSWLTYHVSEGFDPCTWETNSVGKLRAMGSLEDGYPMNRLMKPFGLWWSNEVIER